MPGFALGKTARGERLFVRTRPLHRSGARDQEPNGETIAALLKWIRENLQPNDIAKLVASLAPGEMDEEPDQSQLNGDDPPPFRGQPLTGGKMRPLGAGDSAFAAGRAYGAGFAAGLAKRKSDKKAAKHQAQQAQQAAADAKSFAERFPGAARIRPDDGYGRPMPQRPAERAPSSFARSITDRIKLV